MQFSIKKAPIAIAAAAALFGIAIPAIAGEQDFTLNNNSSHIMKSLYVSPHSADHWGPDILGQDTLGVGDSVTVHFDRDESECNWDVKGDFDGGGSDEVDDVDFCTVSTVNFHD
ncbi:MAG: argininosuccinate lyase [Candidatus Eremiobacteraeota bacterium]|nr:argininosuccinate lyase [Candidatus Eremiobacteraeota bacterium]